MPLHLFISTALVNNARNCLGRFCAKRYICNIDFIIAIFVLQPFCLNNKDKQGRRNKFWSGGTYNLQAKRAEKNELLYRPTQKWQTATVYKFRGSLSGTLRLQPYQPYGWSGPANNFQSWRGHRGHWGKWPLRRPEIAII